MKACIPETMTAVFLDPGMGQLITKKVPVPVPLAGEVLVRMAASPVNPSDLARLRHLRPEEYSTFIPGLEGSGTVVGAGSGLFPSLLKGKRVACSASRFDSGTWAEFLATKAFSCFPVSKAVSTEQAAMHIVNPMTAVAFYSLIRRYRHKAVISTAAAGALGRMIGWLGKQKGIPVIHVVRNEQQQTRMLGSGEPYVLNSSRVDFPETLKTLAGELQASLALDAVGGSLSRSLLRALPAGGTLLVYGNLSGDQPEVDHKSLVTDRKTVSGFFLGNHTHDQGILLTVRDILRVKRLLKEELVTEVQGRFPLQHAQTALETYTGNMTAGKVLLVCPEIG